MGLWRGKIDREARILIWSHSILIFSCQQPSLRRAETTVTPEGRRRPHSLHKTVAAGHPVVTSKSSRAGKGQIVAAAGQRRAAGAKDTEGVASRLAVFRYG